MLRTQLTTLTRERDAAVETITYLTEVLDDKRRLTREIDIILNGDNAAPQASLCDLIPQIKSIMERLGEVKG